MEKSINIFFKSLNKIEKSKKKTKPPLREVKTQMMKKNYYI
jgi:hypothetical protein